MGFKEGYLGNLPRASTQSGLTLRRPLMREQTHKQQPRPQLVRQRSSQAAIHQTRQLIRPSNPSINLALPANQLLVRLYKVNPAEQPLSGYSSIHPPPLNFHLIIPVLRSPIPPRLRTFEGWWWSVILFGVMAICSSRNQECKHICFW
jgi:hypothetical protein